MSKRKIVIATGALILVGGAAALAAVGARDARMGHRDRMNGMDELAQMHGQGSGYGRGQGRDMGHEMGEGRSGGRYRRGGEAEGGQSGEMRRGWFSRSLTAEDFDARTRERFARLDKNSDGVVDAGEIEAAITRNAEGHRPFRDAMRKRFEGRFDANGDGKITRQETLDRVKREFARMDLDGDGRITEQDLPPAMRGRDVLKGGGAGSMGAMRGGRVGSFGLGRLIAADANKDGVITLDEVLAEAGRRFDLADRNKDGQVDTVDRDALTKETNEYRVRRFLHANGGGKDGRVTRDQFFAAAKERFAERDANQDGRLDRQDMGRGMGQGMGRGRGQGPGPGQGQGQGQGQGMEPGTGPGPGMERGMDRGQRPGGPDRGPPR